jgi:hypothetical protein
MKRILIITGLLLAAASYAAVTWLGGRAEEKNSAFRKEFSATAAKIDSQYRHKDTTVKGIKWHYVEQGPDDGPAIIKRPFCPGSGPPCRCAGGFHTTERRIASR